MSTNGLSQSARRIQLKKTAEDIARCDKEIDECHATICKNQEEYDKQLLTLSSGFLGLSIAFIKDIVPTQTAVDRALLYGSFVALLICIISVLISFQISNAGHSKAMTWWQNKRGSVGETRFPYGYAKAVWWINLFSGAVFIVGILLTVSFVIINLHREAYMANQTPTPGYIERGQPMKVPPPPPQKQPIPPSPKK